METTIVAVIFLAILFALMAVRILLVKDGEFRGTCSTQQQALQTKHAITCGVCGQTVEPGMDCSDESKKVSA